MWRLGLDPTLLCQWYPLFHSPLSNIILIYPLNFLLRCYSHCLLHPWTSIIPRLAPFQYFPNVCSIIYAFNMIIPAVEFFYSSSCGLVIACRAKWNQTCGKSDIACFSCRLATFRACTAYTSLYKRPQENCGNTDEGTFRKRPLIRLFWLEVVLIKYQHPRQW